MADHTCPKCGAVDVSADRPRGRLCDRCYREQRKQARDLSAKEAVRSGNASLAKPQPKG